MEFTVVANSFLANLGVITLVALAYEAVLRRYPAVNVQRTAIAVLLASGAVASMAFPTRVLPGVIFDLRHAFVVLSVFYGGLPALAVTATAAVLFRLHLGGTGAPAGVIAIAISAVVSIALCRFATRTGMSLRTAVIFGFAASLSLFSLLALPSTDAVYILKKFGIPLVVANLAGVIVAAKMLERQRKRVTWERVLAKDASTDALTGLANRREFQVRAPALVSDAAKENAPSALLLLDIDHFKSINDTFGHAMGDVVLREVAQTLLSSTRSSDLVARVGGEEFAIILPSTATEQAVVIAEKIRERVEKQAFVLRGITIRITVSIGIHGSRDFGQTLEAALVHADQALYRAKSTGRNKIELASAA